MRLCFLAPADSYHTQKWCRWFSEHGHEVHVISFTEADIENASVHVVKSRISASSSDVGKLDYLFHTREVRKLISEIKPDVISAHRAPSYGMVAALSGAKNYALSVWGEDIYVFPKKSMLHKLLIEYSLHKAPLLLSTSQSMALEASRYTKKRFEITPFGVDMEMFSPAKRTREQDDDNGFVVGTVKSLKPNYGIDYLLKAAAIVRSEHPSIPLRLRIGGTGSHEEIYKQMAKALGIDNITAWLGFIPQEEAAKEWANMDVAVVASTVSESFGVSAVEAQASGVPVIVSDIPGLKESTWPGHTSIVIPRKDEKALAEAIVQLYADQSLRSEMGKAGQCFVRARFEINDCFERIEALLVNPGGLTLSIILIHAAYLKGEVSAA